MAGNSPAYNAKRAAVRKAQARIRAIDRELSNGKLSVVGTRKLFADRQELQDAIEATRTYDKNTRKRIRTAAQTKQAVEALEQLNKRAGFYVLRGNRATVSEINRASSAKAEIRATSRYTNAQVHIFYRETQHIWQNVPPERRNEAILQNKELVEKYGPSLRQIFEGVTGEQKAIDRQTAMEILSYPDPPQEAVTWAMNVLGDNDDAIIISAELVAADNARYMPSDYAPGTLS